MKKKAGKAAFCATVIFTLALALHSAVQAQANDNDGCTLSTLKGDYGLRISGQVFNSAGVVVTQRDGVVKQHYDGAGVVTQEDYVFGNGVLVPGPTDPATGFHFHEQGKYTVNSDCTGTATIDFPSPPEPGTSGAVIEVMFVLSNHGRTIHQIVSSLTPPGPTGGQTTVPANIHADGEKLGRIPDADFYE
ncbi:MAG: hypothetical protein ABSE28_18265 [Candidatus Sulfotelmatobacter sp.]|jgi:hypothetical protein